MDGGGAAGETPAGQARAAAVVQPGVRLGDELGRPVSVDQVLTNMTSAFAKEARRLQESLQRREADQALLVELAAGNFTGRAYERFENELAAYAMSVLRGWMHSGFIFKLTAARGFSLNPSGDELEELFRKSDAREELAIMTVALALPRFREQALVNGGWRLEGGASLSTYFMGACLYVFPNEVRKRRAQRKKWRLQDSGDPGTAPPPTEGRIDDPCVITVGNQRVCDDLGRVDDRTRAVLALTIDGYTQEEIVELLDEVSVRAIEGVLYRWRQKEQNQQPGGGSDG
ncbi:sigma-70 family RNA polymerase sigma factor [Spirilliplanes yamanashiensis]|uniref:sigma-70 family RNA polymerase sigma factor n=1 Tax=Spirilliplanes yamanashiensis TaxID=42233 RepID=UPI0019514A1F|nr:sigma-70 family RNA polymerase sigma factor [Spirilliplanes yamanashiensis]